MFARATYGPLGERAYCVHNVYRVSDAWEKKKKKNTRSAVSAAAAAAADTRRVMTRRPVDPKESGSGADRPRSHHRQNPPVAARLVFSCYYCR